MRKGTKKLRRRTNKKKRRLLGNGSASRGGEAAHTDLPLQILNWVKIIGPVAFILFIGFVLYKFMSSSYFKLIGKFFGKTIDTGLSLAIAVEAQLQACLGASGNPNDATLSVGNIIGSKCPVGQGVVGLLILKYVLKPIWDSDAAWARLAKIRGGAGDLAKLVSSKLQSGAKSGAEFVGKLFSKIKDPKKVANLLDDAASSEVEGAGDAADELFQNTMTKISAEATADEANAAGDSAAKSAAEGVGEAAEEAASASAEALSALAAEEGGEALVAIGEGLGELALEDI
jgi:hypothetical protein